jgi:glc operon protein GlcG
MKKEWLIRLVLAAGIAAFALGASAQQGPIPYGAPISIDNAKKAAAAALAEVRKNNWNMVIAVTDPGGHLVYFERMDLAPVASLEIAIDKSRAAATFKRPTKAFYDDVAAGGGGLRYLSLRGAVPSEGGVPVVTDGKMVGAIGCSGGTGQQDGVCATAGANALK